MFSLEEKARATSIVRYAPDSNVPEHKHPMGEKFLVLEGGFSDEHGDYRAGTCIHNPDCTRHSPFSKDGCTILVKLRQFEPGDDRRFAVETKNRRMGAQWQAGNERHGDPRIQRWDRPAGKV